MPTDYGIVRYGAEKAATNRVVNSAVNPAHSGTQVAVARSIFGHFQLGAFLSRKCTSVLLPTRSILNEAARTGTRSDRADMRAIQAHNLQSNLYNERGEFSELDTSGNITVLRSVCRNISSGQLFKDIHSYAISMDLKNLTFKVLVDLNQTISFHFHLLN